MNVPMLFKSLTLLLLVSLTAAAQEGGDSGGPTLLSTFAGRWTGKAQNSLYTADAIIFARSPNPQTTTLNLTGVITMRPVGGGNPTVLKVAGVHVLYAGEGDLSYTDSAGQPRTTEFQTKLEAAIPTFDFLFLFNSGEFGEFAISLDPTPGIEGVWAFPDGNPVTITRQQDGTYTGTYRGTAASGHAGLSGTLGGTYDQQSGVWDGIFSITEGDVYATGRFEMQRMGNRPDETLEGTLTGSSNIDPVVRTNPIELTRVES